jgi:hypothetical protein
LIFSSPHRSAISSNRVNTSSSAVTISAGCARPDSCVKPTKSANNTVTSE